jgi:hypothetical protein
VVVPVAERVAVETTVWAVFPDGDDERVRVTLLYDPSADPYLVTATFHPEGGPVVWEFGRDLLADGLDGHAGIGEVRLWPSVRPGFVALALSSPDGDALFQVPRSAVARFVRRSGDLVPIGREEGRIDWDAVVRRIGEEARPC